jgi:hypothetical protein
MPTVIAILWLVAIVLLVAAAIGVSAKVSLALLGAAVALLAHSLPAIVAGFSHG